MDGVDETNPRNRLLTSNKNNSAGIFALSVLAALVISFTEVAVRIISSMETFHARQVGLAVCANFALAGIAALVTRIVCLPVSAWAARSDRPTSHQFARFAVVTIFSGMILAWTDMAGAGSELSSAMKWVWIVLGSMVLAVGLGRIARTLFVRRVVIAAWLMSALGTAYAGYSTVEHLQPWIQRHTSSTTSPARGPNILLIVLDTLRFDRVGEYGNSELTPNLDRFADEAYVYTEAISTAPWTLPMHASLFTGLYPREHGVSWGNYSLDESVPVLAELLKQEGYSTFAISNNWLLNRENGFARGFEEFLETPNDARISAWRLALQTSLGRKILNWFDLPMIGQDAGSALTNALMANRFQSRVDQPEPFFAFINYFEPHDPYHPPQDYLERFLAPLQQEQYRRLRQRQDDLCTHACGRRDTFTSQQIELMSALYDAEVAYQDAMFGQLIATLAELGLLDNTWILVTSDHGELFGESNMVFHTASAHYQLLHVPLMVRPPGGTPQRRIETPVQPVDVFHKIVEIGGGRLPSSVTRSYSLPVGEESTPSRQFCVSETFGASITGLYVTQYRQMQTDVTQWLTWMTSIYADGLLLELHNETPKRFFDVRKDPDMNHDLVHEQKHKVNEYWGRYREWAKQDLAGGAT